MGAFSSCTSSLHGDNLLALKALEQDFSGKIKCIYIDPPFNTQQAFEHYDDTVEHSIWLSLMRDRLELLRRLLSPDGTMFVHIDDNELAGSFLMTMKEYPPSQTPGSFNLEGIQKKIQATMGGR
ncbi:MAG: hypothetical protein KJ072_19845 [Verrucomicrobia bacterium]|nr:hypothetical protein [Verrucomicrobiota bacterium]